MKRMKIILILFFLLASTSTDLKSEANINSQTGRGVGAGGWASIFSSDAVNTGRNEVEVKVLAGARLNQQIHIVKRGETLGKISRAYNISIKAILSTNPEITNRNLILVGQQIKLLTLRTAKVNRNLTNTFLSQNEKLTVIEEIASRKGLPWQAVAALSKAESGLGIKMSGDGNKSFGWYHIHSPSHPKVTYEQAMDLRWSTNWACDYLISLGAKEDLYTALRLWNGSLNNPLTQEHADRVMYYAKNTFGLEVNS